MLVTQALNIFVQLHGFLDVLVVGGILREDRIVYNYTIDGGIIVCFADLFLEVVLGHCSEIKVEATVRREKKC